MFHRRRASIGVGCDKEKPFRIFLGVVRLTVASRDSSNCPTRLPQGISEHLYLKSRIIERITQLLRGQTQGVKECPMFRWESTKMRNNTDVQHHVMHGLGCSQKLKSMCKSIYIQSYSIAPPFFTATSFWIWFSITSLLFTLQKLELPLILYTQFGIFFSIDQQLQKESQTLLYNRSLNHLHRPQVSSKNLVTLAQLLKIMLFINSLTLVGIFLFLKIFSLLSLVSLPHFLQWGVICSNVFLF